MAELTLKEKIKKAITDNSKSADIAVNAVLVVLSKASTQEFSDLLDTLR